MGGAGGGGGVKEGEPIASSQFEFYGQSRFVSFRLEILRTSRQREDWPRGGDAATGIREVPWERRWQ